MPVVPFTARPNQSQPIPKVDQTYLMMAAAELHEAGRLIEPNPQSKGPPIHPPEWRGNKQYKEIFEKADEVVKIETETGRIIKIKMPGSTKTQEPEINPKFIPDSRGMSPSGWNRVG